LGGVLFEKNRPVFVFSKNIEERAKRKPRHPAKTNPTEKCNGPNSWCWHVVTQLLGFDKRSGGRQNVPSKSKTQNKKGGTKLTMTSKASDGIESRSSTEKVFQIEKREAVNQS